MIEEKQTGKIFAAKYLNKKKLQAIEFGKGALVNEIRALRMLDNSYCI